MKKINNNNKGFNSKIKKNIIFLIFITVVFCFFIGFLKIKTIELKKIKEKNYFLETRNEQLEKENKEMHELVVYNLSNEIPLKKKIAFLTFDDGPSEYSKKFLEILKNNNIKANFFLLGKKIDMFPETIKEIAKEGHGIFIHSDTHDYEFIYSSPETLKQDINTVINKIKILGLSSPKIYRFPGGSNNEFLKNEYFSEIKKFLKENSITYIDWNVDSGDASSQNVKSNTIINNIVEQCSNKKIVTILMHDTETKETTLKALPQVIAELKKLNFNFLVLPNGIYAPKFK